MQQIVIHMCVTTKQMFDNHFQCSECTTRSECMQGFLFSLLTEIDQESEKGRRSRLGENGGKVGEKGAAEG